MKDRAKTLADHLKKKGGESRPESDSPSSNATLWENLPFGKLLKKELSSYIVESSKNLEDLGRVKQMLAEVMENRLSGIKQSLLLSRMSQLSEAQLARLAQLEWQTSNLDEITKRLNRIGIKSITEAYQELYQVKQLNFELLKEIQTHNIENDDQESLDIEILEEKDTSESLKGLTDMLDQLSSLRSLATITSKLEELEIKR